MSSEDINNTDVQNEEQLQEKYIQSFAQVAEGQMLPGEVIELSEEYVYLDVGLKSEGKIPLSEFEQKPRIGETISFY